MIRGIAQLHAIWAKAGALRKFGGILKNKAVLRGAADVGTDVAFRGVGIARKANKGSLIGRMFRSRKIRKAQFGLDVGASLGFAALGIKEALDVRKVNAERQAAVRRFSKNLNRTQQRLQRVRRVGQ
jgi:hypothetical protein